MKPNVLCVSIDSLRGDYCSFLDSERETTPFLANVSKQSTIYESAITPSTWTLPVHTSIFSGLFPPEHGVITGGEVLGDQPTFAEVLRESDYQTRAFYQNAWLDTGGIIRGFETSSDDDSSEGDSLKARFADAVGSVSPTIEKFLEQGYDGQMLYREWANEDDDWTGKERPGENDVDSALEQVEELTEPFCWFVHLNDAHWQYEPPKPHHKAFTDRSALSLTKNIVYWQERVYGSRTSRLETISGAFEPPNTEVQTFRDLYQGAIRYCDALIEKLVRGLQSAGVWDETVLIVFGDHGDSFGENDVFGHHFTTDESVIRVPLLIRDPTQQLQNGHVSDPVSLVDLYPTILDLAGVDVPDNSGIELTEGTRSEAYTYYDISDHEYYTQAPDRGVSKDDLPAPTQHVVWRSADDRLTHYPQSNEYEVRGDRREELQNRLEDHRNGLTKVATGGQNLSGDVERRLEDMGYLKE